MSRYGWRPEIESALSLDVWRLHKEGVLRDGTHGYWQWTCNGEPCGRVAYAVKMDGPYCATLTLRYSDTNRDGEREDVTCPIRLASIPLHYGGARWYAFCPCTDHVQAFAGLAALFSFGGPLPLRRGYAPLVHQHGFVFAAVTDQIDVRGPAT